MNNLQFEILSDKLLPEFCLNVPEKSLSKFNQLEESEITLGDFSFYTSVSAVFSSKIEGENIELDSYVKHKRFGIEYLPDYTKKIDDLYNAYLFAKQSDCNQGNIEIIHKMLTKHILPESKQGKVRNGNMYVTTVDGKIEYVAAQPLIVQIELLKFYNDLQKLRNATLSVQEVFYYAAFLDLVFAKIHPFDDGNGRTSRLIEKWFLAEKLGEKAWFIQSEKNYYLQHQKYYQNIRLLGMEYEYLDYSKASPFLNMLPMSLSI